MNPLMSCPGRRIGVGRPLPCIGCEQVSIRSQYKVTIMKSFLHTFAPALLAACMLPLVGCESPTGVLLDSERGAGATIPMESGAIADFSSMLTQELELSAVQRSELQREIDERGHPDQAPGNLWFVSARLQQMLTERQMTMLFNVAVRLRGDHLRKLVGVYGPCTFPSSGDEGEPERRTTSVTNRRLGAGGGGNERGDDGLLVQNRRAMIAALGLADAQIDGLDQLHRTQCGATAEIVRRARAGERSRDEVLAALDRLVTAKVDAYERILDREQLETATIHDGLLVVNARRYVHHVANRHHEGQTTDRPEPSRIAAAG